VPHAGGCIYVEFERKNSDQSVLDRYQHVVAYLWSVAACVTLAPDVWVLGVVHTKVRQSNTS